MSESNTADNLCTVCHEEYNTPVILTCQQQHVLCLSCARLRALTAHAKGQLRDEASIQRMLAKDDTGEVVKTEKKDESCNEGSDTFPCPVCGEAVAYDLGKQTLGLSVKAAASVSGDSGTDMGGTSKESEVCVICESRVADVHCGKCEASHCDECASVTHEPAKMNSRSVEPLSCVSLTKPKASTPLCAEHNKPLDMACVKDEVPVCAQCLLNGPHREQIGDDWIPHECQSIAEAVKTVTEDLQAVLVRCETHQHVVEKSHAAVAQTAALLYKSYCDRRANVEAYFVDLIRQLECVREEKLKEVETIYQKQHALYESQISLLGSARVAIRETLSIGRLVLSRGETDGAIQLQQRQSAVSVVKEATSLCRDKLVPVTRSVGLSHMDCTRFIEEVRRGIVCYVGGIHELRVRPQSQTSWIECPFSAVIDAYDVRGHLVTDVTSGAAAGSTVTAYAQLSGDSGVRCDLSVVRERDSFVVRWPSSSGNDVRDGKWQVYYAVSGSTPRLLAEFQCGIPKYCFDASTVTDNKALTVSDDGLSVRLNVPGGLADHSVLGPLLPNHGRHTWRLRMSGALAGQTVFHEMYCGVSAATPLQCYSWGTDGKWTPGNARYQRDNPVCTFAATDTPEVELTLDSDHHTLTMRRLDNGQWKHSDICIVKFHNTLCGTDDVFKR